MADNEMTDDGESELQFVSTKTERLKLSWPIRDWSERTAPARTRRWVSDYLEYSLGGKIVLIVVWSQAPVDGGEQCRAFDF